MPEKKANSKKRTTKAASKSNGKGQNAEQPKGAYFLSLTVENVRCFGSPAQVLDLSNGSNKPKQWTIILGDNGTGKTTLLQSIVAMLPTRDRTYNDDEIGEIDLSVALIDPFSGGIKEWKPFRKVGNDKDVKSLLEAKFSYQKQLETAEPENVFRLNARNRHSNDYWSTFLISNLFAVNGFAYGASRKAGKTSLSEQNNESTYATLFDETILLLNPEEWLLQADYAASRHSVFKEKRKEELELVKRILINTLPDVDDIRFTEKKEGRTPQPIVEFHTHYGWVESKDLSLGYRTSMAWIVDFASRMFDLYPESENPLGEPAVVLIDEIDLHLHPKWQRDLIDYLTNLFPNTQFIVTTHSPLIVQAAAARDANLVVLRREGDHVVIDQSIEAVRGWRADQILTSDLFDLPSARPKETEDLLEQRKRILSKAILTKADEKKLKEISEKLGALPVMENLEDDKAMDIIRRAAAHLQQEKK